MIGHGLTISGDGAHPVKVTAEDGTNNISTWAANWPREIVSGSVANWMSSGDFGGGPVAIAVKKSRSRRGRFIWKTGTVVITAVAHAGGASGQLPREIDQLAGGHD